MYKVNIRRAKRGLGWDSAARRIGRAARETLKAQGVDADCEIEVTLTDNAGIREINLSQRGIDAPTDVLSFPANELEEGVFDAEKCEFDYDADCCFLGDVVISLERCASQAEEYGHSFDREVCYLTAHSVLHLLGYDHVDDGERKAHMREREEEVMRRLGL